jgi:prepilin-type N-terminal cleavage/methylation domain-containing protein/prepilin-type processing-associated H-X9-DG protein
MVQPIFGKRRRKRGFTIIELLITITIITILVALLMPAVQQAREAARRAKCKNNLRQIGVAIHLYHETHRTYPPGQQWDWGSQRDSNANPIGRLPGWGWSAFILPFIDQNTIYVSIDFNLPLNDISNSKIDASGNPQNGKVTRIMSNREIISTSLSVFMCPSDRATPLRNRNTAPNNSCTRPGAICNPGQAWSSYHAAAGSYRAQTGSTNRLRGNGAFRRLRAGKPSNFIRRISDFRDGDSNTIMFGESSIEFHNSGKLYGSSRSQQNDASGSHHLMKTGEGKMNPPRSARNVERNYNFGSLHPGGAHFLFGDGRVIFLTESIQHTARTWDQQGVQGSQGSNNANAYDRKGTNGNEPGEDYGIYQRLFSIDDNNVVGAY